MDQPIDVVITWVDGNDENHQAKRMRCLQNIGGGAPASAAPTRFNQVGEIKYCVQAILKFIPWIRKIFIVTDAQVPEFLKNNFAGREKIILIDHQHIFRGYTQFLPTFNSLTIEAFLWRIAELTEHFIYFNDDCFLLKPLTPADFFKDNKLVLRGYWKKNKDQQWLNRAQKFLGLPLKQGAEDNPHRYMQEQSALRAGLKGKFFYLPHMPFALRKSDFARCYEEYPQWLSECLQYPFRNEQQYWPISLMVHRAILQKQVFIIREKHEVTINGSCQDKSTIFKRLQRAERWQAPYICLQSLDSTPVYLQKHLVTWLNSHLFS